MINLKALSFRPLGLSESLLQALSRVGFKQPYPVQQEAIPLLLSGKDLLVIAKTGSGKTASYLLPILQRIQDTQWMLKNRSIPVLILVPTRELAMQVHEVLQLFSEALPDRIKSMAVFGGVSINPQMIGMQGAQVLIATPGRLLDLLDSKALSLSELKILVLDEADKLLNKGFKEELDGLLKLMPKKRQNVLFSATLNTELQELSRLLLDAPAVVQILDEEEKIELIQQRAFRVDETRKGPFLRYLIKSKEMHQVLIFTSSIYNADHVADKLRKNGIDAQSSHSKKSNKARQEALAQFKNGTLRVLVTTDLLSRGIDIAFLPYVINYDLPRSPKDFIHRIGRTGRAENPGEAFSILSPAEQEHFKVIQKKMGLWLTLEGTEELDLHGY